MSSRPVTTTEESLRELIATRVKTYGGNSSHGRFITGIEVFGVKISPGRLSNSDCIELLVPLLQKNIQEFIESVKN